MRSPTMSWRKSLRLSACTPTSWRSACRSTPEPRNGGVCVDIAEPNVQQGPERLFGWLQHSFALHELKRTREALDALLPAARVLPGE